MRRMQGMQSAVAMRNYVDQFRPPNLMSPGDNQLPRDATGRCCGWEWACPCGARVGHDRHLLALNGCRTVFGRIVTLQIMQRVEAILYAATQAQGRQALIDAQKDFAGGVFLGEQSCTSSVPHLCLIVIWSPIGVHVAQVHLSHLRTAF